MKESTRFKNKKLAKTNNGVKKAAKGARTGAKIVGIGLAITPVVKKYGKDGLKIVKEIISR